MIKQNLPELFQNFVYLGQAGISKRERNKGCILIVDDQIDIITLLCDFLSEKGYKAVGYSSGKDALKALKAQNFDLLLTDLTMPELNGLELMNLIYEIDPLMVCIVITGNVTVQTAVDAMKAGAFDYILKPFKMKDILPVVTRAMEMRRLRDSEKKYRAIVEDQTEMICRFLPGGIVTFVNEPYCRYFETKSEDLIGKSFLPMIFEEDRESVVKTLESLGRENSVAAIEYRVIKPDGDIRWHQWTNRILFDNHGRTEYQSVGRDITERKKIEEFLQKNEKELQKRVKELEEFYEAAVGRELKMIELKEEVERLKEELKKYKSREI